MNTGWAGDRPRGESRATPGAHGSTRRIRVVFGMDNLGIGGTELNAVRTAERLDPARFEVTVACLQQDGPLRARYAAAGVPVVSFPISSLYGLDALRQGLRLYRYLQNRRIDIFHAHDIYSNVFGVPWARLAGIPGVIASRRWWANRPLSKLERVNRIAYRIAHRVLANSEGVARFCTEADHVPANRVVVVSNFVDDDAFAPPDPMERATLLDSLGIPQSATILGIVANLSPVKDHETLLRALARIAPRWPDLVLVAIGDGACRGSLEALARELQIRDRVIFTGRRVERINLHHLFAISVLCSRSEGFPNSIIEAMAASRPVVATDVGAAADAVVEGETGMLVPSAEPCRLGDAIEQLLENPERARKMGLAGLKRARELFSADTALTSLEQVYAELLSGRASMQPQLAPDGAFGSVASPQRTRAPADSMTAPTPAR